MSRGFFFGLLFFLFGTVVLAAEPPAAKDQQWGDLTGRFIFDGEPPKPIELNVNKDMGVVKGPIFDESLVVDVKSRGIANVFVWLVPDRDKLVATHPDYKEAKKAPVILQMKGLRFQPHCVVFQTGQKLTILNKDPVGHHTPINSNKNPEFHSLIPSGGPVDKVLKNSEPVPLSISCSIHPWENGCFLVQDHPYMALTSTTGEFIIKNLPVGKHSFRVWHETCGFVTKVRRDGHEQQWMKGRLEIEIKPGWNDLGDVLVSNETLQRKR